jgi:hypothetical protein
MDHSRPLTVQLSTVQSIVLSTGSILLSSLRYLPYLVVCITNWEFKITEKLSSNLHYCHLLKLIELWVFSKLLQRYKTTKQKWYKHTNLVNWTWAFVQILFLCLSFVQRNFFQIFYHRIVVIRSYLLKKRSLPKDVQYSLRNFNNPGKKYIRQNRKQKCKALAKWWEIEEILLWEGYKLCRIKTR